MSHRRKRDLPRSTRADRFGPHVSKTRRQAATAPRSASAAGRRPRLGRRARPHLRAAADECEGEWDGRTRVGRARSSAPRRWWPRSSVAHSAIKSRCGTIMNEEAVIERMDAAVCEAATREQRVDDAHARVPRTLCPLRSRRGDSRQHAPLRRPPPVLSLSAASAFPPPRACDDQVERRSEPRDSPTQPARRHLDSGRLHVSEAAVAG